LIARAAGRVYAAVPMSVHTRSSCVLFPVLALVGCATPPPPPAAPPIPSAAPPASVAAPEPTAPSTPRDIRVERYAYKSVQILGGGFVTGIVFSPAKADLVYARTDIGGAYRYSPKDDTWIALTDMFGRDDGNLWGVESIAPDPRDPNVVTMACGMYTQDWAPMGAFLRSTDQGVTWKVVRAPFKLGGNEDGRSNGERLAVDPNSPNTVFFGSRKNGLYTSTDAAATWKEVSGFPTVKDSFGAGITFVLFDAASGKQGKATPHLYAGVAATDPSLYESRDGGATWQPVKKQPKGLLPSHGDLDKNGILYVTYGNHPGPNNVTTGAVHKLDPKTGTWTDITPLVPSADDKFGYGGLGLDRSKPGTLVVSTIDRWTKTDEIFRTTDGGKHWTKVGANAHWDVNGAAYIAGGKKELKTPHWMGDIRIDPFRPDRAAFVTGAGLWTTSDLTKADKNEATGWRFWNRGLEETSVDVIVSPPQGAPLLSGVGDICGFRHDDLDVAPKQGAFMEPGCNATTGIDFAESDPSFVVRVGRVWDFNKQPRGAYSTDAGSHWAPFAAEPDGSPTGGVVAVTADGKTILWSPKDAVASYSRDRGATWKPVAGLPKGHKIPDWANFDIQPAADRKNPAKMYVLDAMGGQVFRSKDGGASFEVTKASLPQRPDWGLGTSSIRAVPGFEGHVWITTGEKLMRSTDSAATFSAVPDVEESYGVGFGKAADGAKYPAVYLIAKIRGTKGIYRSDDAAASFVRIDDDNHKYAGTNLVAGDPRVFGRIYLGTPGRGILYGMPAK
jgi:hypothetical protein